MKNFLSILILFSFFLNEKTFAKQKFGLDLGVGLKGGLNFSKFNANGFNRVYHTDPHAGFFLHLNKRRFGAQLEAVWTQTQVTTDSTFEGLYQQYMHQGIDSINKASFKFSTISLPILLNIKLSQVIWVQLGPQFSANVAVTDKNNIMRSGKSIIAQNNYSAVGGIWLQFGGNAPLLRVNLGARFIYGLTNLNQLTQSSRWHNQMLQLHLGLSY